MEGNGKIIVVRGQLSYICFIDRPNIFYQVLSQVAQEDRRRCFLKQIVDNGLLQPVDIGLSQELTQ